MAQSCSLPFTSESVTEHLLRGALGCIDVHTKAAKAAGATPEEMAEVVFITAAIQAGAAVGHGQMVMRMYSQTPSPAMPPKAEDEVA